MMDYGHRKTEALLRALEAEIEAEYTAAGKEVAEAADAFFHEFELEDAKYAEAVDKGAMSATAYQRWRRGKLARGEGYRQMRDDIARRIKDAAQIAEALGRHEKVVMRVMAQLVDDGTVVFDVVPEVRILRLRYWCWRRSAVRYYRLPVRTTRRNPWEERWTK